ncbi:DUF4157 domain-containing protein [Streptomyces sp. NRRL F-5123]|uniref:eCIS core domain-containing protein n=1 Tax=Streptomyces sp. NRRL F-5123 TaxID=1463856 RepID=UPI000694F888|nr:DUF4157 domain-containing protein [Streptomyces sp. NRRL F-5123]
MRDHGKASPTSTTSGRVPARKPEAGGRARGPRFLSLQRTAGNAAVVQMLQRSGRAGDTPVHDVLRTGGQPLGDATRTEMEARLGADFSDVRVHTDAAARASAADLGARAYTSGNHIVIGDGGSDKHTLAHELTHVLQQRQGPVAGTDDGSGLKVSDPSDRFERAAEANATHVMRLDTAEADPVQRAATRSARGRPAAQRAVGPAATPGPLAVQRAGEITPLTAAAHAGHLGPGQTPSEAGGAGTVALVPAVLTDNLDLHAIAATYDTGFTGNTAPADRFALVIGVNCWLRKGQNATAVNDLLTRKINDFTGRWDNDRFRVEVIGFTWHDHRVSSPEQINQTTIPYGEIRDRIMRHPVVSDLVNGLTAAGREHVYLHSGDSDTQSFDTEQGPLFSAAAAVLDTGETDLFSGGYTSPVAARDTDEGILVWHANRVDQAVRDAMSEVHPHSVYYPEPNTFVKVKTDWDMDQLEEGISFGTGSEEGAQLVNSLRATRDGVNESFDSRYAISTDMGRIGSKVGGHARGESVDEATLKKLFTLAQSHARKQEWAKRVGTLYNLPPAEEAALADAVYDQVTNVKALGTLADKNLTLTTVIDKGFKKRALAKQPDLASVNDAAWTMASKSRDRLLFAFTRAYRELKARPRTAQPA